MASPDLPIWVWNLIIAIQRHEELHGRTDTCLGGVLFAVPDEIRSQAEAIGTYIQKAHGNELADKAAKTWDDLMAAFFPKPADESGEAAD
ncbi:hypothetical protein AB0I27_22615 [Streptomyces sp. NPDC050597]|uniref:hypothetical protein n=1 Tax=Streptomyces sp. NPDC050597 TaxID=3157212 RepID=UPI00341D7A6D